MSPRYLYDPHMLEQFKHNDDWGDPPDPDDGEYQESQNVQDRLHAAGAYEMDDIHFSRSHAQCENDRMAGREAWDW